MFSTKLPGVAIVNHGVQRRVTRQNDTAAITAVTAVRPAPGNIFFPTETDAATTAVTSEYFYGRLIDKFHVLPLRVKDECARFGPPKQKSPVA